MPSRKSALNTFCGSKGVSSVCSFPGHPSKKGGWGQASMAAGPEQKGRSPKSQRSGSSVLDTKWQIGTC